MPIEQEVDAGLKLFNQILRAYGKLELREARPLSGRRAYYAVIGSRDEGLKQVDIVLSYEFLSDLPNTPEYQLSAQIYGRLVAGRMGNPHPMDFYCKAGLPIRVEIDWPFESIAQRAASFVHVSIEDLRRRNLYAKCSFIMTQQQFIFDLQKNSFLREAAIINTARRAVDGGRLTFYPREEHPVQLIEFPFDTQFRPSGLAVAIDQFIAGKVFWLGFRQGDKRTKVWIADPSDADYLGSDPHSLIQTAQVLEAEKKIVMDSSQEYATAAEGLLLQAKHFSTASFSTGPSQDSLHGPTVTRTDWDVFICHASEDKDEFVRPLAEELRRNGLKVWYDEFALKVGDSLRRTIDRGLRQSRYGIVVLSPAFFGKEWPQKELDGLVAKEVDGKKVILPVWHKVNATDVRKYSLMLADKVAAQSSQGVTAVVTKLLEVLEE